MDIFETVLVYALLILITVVFIYPLLRYIFLRSVLFFRCLFLPKGCFLIALKPLWAFLPRLWRKRPDFAIFCNNEIFLFKLFAFRRKRKRIVFLSPDKWEIANDFSVININNYQYQENNLIDNIIAFKHKIKAPSYLVDHSEKIMNGLKSADITRCIPVVLILPSVNKMFIKNGGSLISGDTIFYGVVVANYEYLIKILKKNNKKNISLKEKNKIKKAVKKAIREKV
jgi:hypothetical protein